MSQLSLDMPDRLRAPFWKVVWRYGSKIRTEDDELRDIIRSAWGGSEHGQHSVWQIGDADGPLWTMDNPFDGWIAHERAPAPDPYKYAGLD